MASATTLAAAEARVWSAQRVASVATVAASIMVVLVAATVTGQRTPLEIAAITGCAALLAALADIDVRLRVLPNAIVYPALAIVLMVAWGRADQSLGGALAGAAFAASPFLVAFFLIQPRTVRARPGSRPLGSGRKGDVKWAGLVGAGGVLLAALVQADQAMGGAIAAAIVAGGPFVASFVDEHRNRCEDKPVVVSGDGRGMGGGDVKLAALLGVIAGVPGVLAALTVVVFGGACAAVALIVMRHGGGAIPYGPFLAAGAVVAMV
ncbi:MAG: prepilin peptidase [Dehalococcoidia bacterium]